MDHAANQKPVEILRELKFESYTEFPRVLRRMRDASSTDAEPVFYRAAQLNLFVTFAYVPGVDAVWVANSDFDLTEHGFRDVTDRFTTN